MKELFKVNTLVLAIYDDKNYCIYDESKPIVDKKNKKVTYKKLYFNSIVHGIKELCRLTANKECHDLKSWLESYEKVKNSVEDAVTV